MTLARTAPPHPTHLTQWERRIVTVSILLYAALAFAYSWIVPPFETPDEQYHYAYARNIAQGNGLPVQTEEQLGPWEHEGSQTPLYYALTGALTSPIDQSDFPALSVLNPRANIGNPLFPGNKNQMLYSAAPRPLVGSNLALHIGRWFSTLLGVISLWCIYRTARLAFAPATVLAVVALAVTAAIPQFIFISASFSNDSSVIVMSSLTIFWLARLLVKDRDAAPTLGEWMVLGVLLGLAGLSKLHGLGLWVLAAATALYMAWQRREWKLLLVAALPVALPALAIAGWWYWRNYTLYGDWTGLARQIDINGLRTEPLGLIGWLNEFRGLRYSFWGLFGWFNILLPTWIYHILDGVTLLAVAGCIGHWLVRIRTGAPGDALQNDAAHRAAHRVRGLLAAWIVLMSLLLVYWMSRAIGSQGRLLFPMLGALIIWLVYGLEFWVRLVPPRMRPVARGALPVLLLGCALYAPLALFPAAYAAPDPIAEVPASAQPVDVLYGSDETIRLLALETPQERFRPGEHVPVTLYLQTDAPLRQDYQLFIQLLDENRVELGNVTTHPGWGRNPTTLWQPGAIYADRYEVWIERPIDNRAPLLATVYVGFVDPATEKSGRLPVPATNSAGETITPFLASVAITPGDQSSAEALGLSTVGSHYGNVIRLEAASAPVQAQPGAVITTTLLWEATGTPAADYTAFVHVLDAAGDRLTGFDQEPAVGRFPTRHWRSGDRIVSEFPVPIPPDAPPGDYALWVGLYDPAQGAVRLPLTDAAGQPAANDTVQIGSLTISAP